MYTSCSIEAFTQRPREEYPEKVYFKFVFNTPMFREIHDQAVNVLFQEPPRITKSGYTTLNVGDLYLIIDNAASSTVTSSTWMTSTISSTPTSIELTTTPAPTTPV
ncbi:unnamed protein product, partial [Lymnaea stagnalis]